MAPLYKRYIPPKANAAPPPAPAIESPKPTPPIKSNVDSPKRKRERTEEEVASRKAKKLKKKGVDPETVEDLKSSKASIDAEPPIQAGNITNGSAAEQEDGPKSEFAHVKDKKKRHRLEKEARNARIAAEKAEKKADVNGSARVEEPAGIASTVDKGQDDTGAEAQNDAVGSEKSKKKEKKRKKEKEKSESVQDAENITESPPANGTPERPKKNQKNKRRKEDEHEVPEETSEDMHLGAEGNDETQSQPKKRKHKLEAVLQGDAQDAAEDEDDHLKKHGGILKKYQKSLKLAQTAPQPEPHEEDPTAAKPVVLDLAPLPQPEPAPVEKFVPDDSALPPWLAKPTIVSSNASRSPFSDLKLNPKTIDHLSKLGFNDVLPVQQALVPLLLPPGMDGAQFPPGTESVVPDVAVSAPTGSGKTIAYLLPIIESLKASKHAGEDHLKALVVVPTRELVMQVAAVAESLSKGSTIKVGMATGTGAFKEEQTKLTKHGRRYDPRTYNELLMQADKRNFPPPQDSEDFDSFLDELEQEDTKQEQRIKDTVTGLPDHVPTYFSAIDILVATPGRLLDHLKSTLGFTLAHLEYLVLDEADKLLDLQYDGFLESINAELERPRDHEEQDARERFLRDQGTWDERKERRVRKIVLSATMTRDISKLVALKLKRPRMVVVRGSEPSGEDGVGKEDGREGGDVFELPPTLREFAVPVGDGSEKPLYLVELLRTRILGSTDLGNDAKDDQDDSESEDISSSDTSSDTTSSTDSDSDSGTSTSSTPQPPSPKIHPTRLSNLQPPPAPTILLFTSSTETSHRLHHTLTHLLPTLAPNIHPLTRTKTRIPTPTSPSTPTIVIATDRAGRGLDAVGKRPVTHVVQYDVPRSVTGYVHRVGRTARAGGYGEGWTLVGGSEGRWFWKVVAGGKEVRREGVVERVKVGTGGEGMRRRLGEVLEGVRGVVFGGKGKGKGRREGR